MKEHPKLPAGVEVFPLVTHRDHRGAFTEVFRESWSPELQPSRWEVLGAEAGVLRGVHVHPRCDSYLVLLQGRATVGLCDLREGREQGGRAATVELSSEAMAALKLPGGVAQGIYFHEPSLLARALSAGDRPEPELGCAWDDPGLGIAWPERRVRVSAGDAALPSLGALQRRLAEWMGGERAP